MHASRIACGYLLFLIACGTLGESTGGNDDRRYLIAMNSQRIDTRVTPDEAAASGGGRMLVKFPGPVTAEQLAALAATAQIYTYLPYDTFLVRPLGGLVASRPTGASWTGAYLPAYKVSRAVAALAQQASPAAADTTTRLKLALGGAAKIPAISPSLISTNAMAARMKLPAGPAAAISAARFGCRSAHTGS